MPLNVPKTISKAPITDVLIEPMRIVSEYLPSSAKLQYDEAYRRAYEQVVLLNDKLTAIQKQLSAGGVVLESSPSSGSSGGGGSTVPTPYVEETPTPVPDGVTTVFVLARAPNLLWPVFVSPAPAG